MKKVLTMFLSLLLIFAVLVSCGTSVDTSSEDAQTESSVTISEDVSSVEGDEESQEPDESESPEQPRERQSGYADFIKSGSDIRSIAFYDKYTLIILREEKAEIYDIADAKLIGEQKIEVDDLHNIIICNDGGILYTSYFGSYTKFNSIESETPSIVNEVILDDNSDEYGNEFDYVAPDSYQFSQNGKYVRLSGMVLYGGEIDGNEEAELVDISELGLYSYCYIYDFDGKYVYIIVSTEMIRYDIDTDDVVYVSAERDASQSIYNGRLYENYYQDSFVTVYSFGNGYKTEVLYEGETEVFSYGKDNLIFTYEQFDETEPFILRVYDQEGNLYLRETVDVGVADAYVTKTVNYEDSTAYIINRDIEYSEDAAGERYVYIVINDFTNKLDRGFSKSLADLMRDFRNETGFEAYAGEAASIWFMGYDTEVCESKYLVSKVLETVKDVLSEFPEGFFDEMLSGNSEYTDKELAFYIVSSITGRGDGTISSAIAFTYSDNNRRMVIIDAYSYYSDELRNTVAHELMHAVNDYMSFSSFDGDPPFADWYDYVPNNSYAYSYVDKYGNDYTASRYTVLDTYEDVYFIDGYSRTYPTEDRSRLFEYMFCPEKAESSGCFEYRHIAERAAYLASEIRRCFKSVSASDELIWEKTIKEYTDYKIAA